jgi:hypothetical protein
MGASSHVPLIGISSGPWQDALVSDDGAGEIAGTLAAFGAPPLAATARVLRQSPQRRLRRALAALGICWGAAVPCIFIPLAHFFLVPTLVTTGIVLAVLRAREDTRLLGVHGRCPRCGVEQDFPAAGRLRGERSLDCPRCRNHLTFAPAVVP